mgnify:CR=1 FL=1
MRQLLRSAGTKSILFATTAFVLVVATACSSGTTEQASPAASSVSPSAEAASAEYASQQEVVDALQSKVCTKDFQYGCLEHDALDLMNADLGSENHCAKEKYPYMRWN